jgi:hypothetical protein
MPHCTRALLLLHKHQRTLSGQSTPDRSCWVWCPHAGSSFSQQWVAYQEEQAAETQVKTLHRLIQRAYPVLHAYSQEVGYLNEHVR